MVPEGWIITQLSELADIKRGAGSQYLTYVEAPDDGIRLIRISDFLGDSKKYVLHTSAIDRFILRKDDILIAGTGATAGIIFRVPDEYSGLPFSYNAPRIRPKTTSCSGYLYYFLCSDTIIRQQHALFTGNAQPFLDTRAIGGFKVLAPPVLEQKRIAQILSTWDQAITATERLLKNSQQRKKGLMQQLLTGKKRLLSCDGEPFSDNWEVKKISQISSRIQRKTDGGKHPILTISSRSGFVKQEDKYSRYMAGESVKNYILLERGEFAYNKGNSKTYEFGCVFDLEQFDRGLVPHVYVCFKLNAGMSHRYFKYLFEADYLKPQLGSLVNTGVRNNGLLNIKPSEFLSTTVPVPCIEEQERVADVLYSSSAEIEALSRRLNCLRKEKKALMQQLLTGKRRVNVETEAA
ncbi:restriction endonuclease subunit S [Marinimicrobium alkaliphilum]|uniref:restriction endonuclease subunit S n=1 Tax=Marinimicrobium alkaliphilum TaxID=2202654 RepID=UPI000DBA1477|nr:restriction endonuclease subunit S [Marinimicrobium alkaliphilum]